MTDKPLYIQYIRDALKRIFDYARVELASRRLCYDSDMGIVEAQYENGVLRPLGHLPLRDGERVGLVLLRHPDTARWDETRLSDVTDDEKTFAEAGLAEWAAALEREDQR